MGKPWTPDSLADRWGVSGETVRQMCADGRLAAFWVGRMWRIPAAAVENYERRNTESGASTGGSSSRGPETTASDAVFVLKRGPSRPQRRKASTSSDASTRGHQAMS